ncbi:MAG: after-VIT domain-containing protein, partial [Microcoleus sp. SIO2G3]|nr:after-VIT domain-containing protein [Microcoleus sp. SIO2G3]
GKLHITGTAAGGDRYEQIFDLQFEQLGNPSVAQLWGRARIKQLTNQMVSGDTKSGVEAVTETALAYQLLSQYTAFVAVSDDVRSNPQQQSVSVQVPVEMSEAVSYIGIYGSAAAPPPPMMSRMMFEAAAPAPASAPPPPAAPAPAAAGGIDWLGGVGDFLSNTPAARLRKTIRTQKSIQIVSATGLDADAIDRLTQHLQTVQLPTGFSGEVVFEFQIRNRRVIQLVLDEQASTLKESTVIDELRRSLLAWRVVAAATAVRLVLQIQS